MNKITRKAVREAAETHRTAMMQTLQRRMEVARANGDEKLLRQLEAEANYLR
ncbi:hypothetical protein CKA32_003948 [Geitlerinema sp. FC II]|uniref:arginine synthesis PII-interacting regulator PirA n=1 Tax=Baaleninema simplex TaxID=2862350 RepID=UPI000344F2FE|nr:hypothetical protein [Baaleninema simplex]MDC0833368.1 hypothetical protein [Geitlerinema sp. CS-897]PPT06442.1 hypothetical protein CKA32_003948 [Geitlerinema sp. FC II]